MPISVSVTGKSLAVVSSLATLLLVLAVSSLSRVSSRAERAPRAGEREAGLVLALVTGALAARARAIGVLVSVLRVVVLVLVVVALSVHELVRPLSGRLLRLRLSSLRGRCCRCCRCCGHHRLRTRIGIGLSCCAAARAARRR